MKTEIFAWEYNPESKEYTIPSDTKLKTLEEYNRAANQALNKGKYLYQLYIDDKYFNSFKSDKQF
jgi:hypothetical protein